MLRRVIASSRRGRAGRAGRARSTRSTDLSSVHGARGSAGVGPAGQLAEGIKSVGTLLAIVDVSGWLMGEYKEETYGGLITATMPAAQ